MRENKPKKFYFLKEKVISSLNDEGRTSSKFYFLLKEGNQLLDRKCEFQGQRRYMGVCLAKYKLREIYCRASATSWRNDKVPINVSSRGLEVKVAPKQGRKDLKYDVEVSPTCGLRSGST